MKISRNWLQSYFSDPLPSNEALEAAFTFHVFEIDGIEEKNGDAILDVKVTPNRGHDCLSHLGIAKELSAILKLPLNVITNDSGEMPAQSLLASKAKQSDFAASSPISVTIQTDLCLRYSAALLTGVKVGPSPQWLRERLESIGQRSINNIVDATNYVMFDLGQPLHAFDASKLKEKEGNYSIAVRAAGVDEKMVALDEKEYTLTPSTMVIADQNADVAIGIAGVKGGQPASITDATTNIILESANFNGASVRKTAQVLKLRTDASTRFEQVLSPTLVQSGMQAVCELLLKIAGGDVIGFIDEYPHPQKQTYVTVTTEQVTKLLGTTVTGADIADTFLRLGFSYKEEAGVFEVQPPFERLDLEIPEDLIEEVGRIQGYDKVPAILLPPIVSPVTINARFYRQEKIREFLIAQGFSEVFTSVFTEKGERVVLNKVDGVKPYLRTSLTPGLVDALEKNIRNKELLGIKQIKLFEIGSVWQDGKEEIDHDLIVEKVKKQKTTEEYTQALETYLAALPANSVSYDTLPLTKTERYRPFSKYPYIVRDVAFWVSIDIEEEKIRHMIAHESGELCVSISLFDRFQKEEKTSFAYRLIFQSFERTLTEVEVNVQIEKVYEKLKQSGYEIR